MGESAKDLFPADQVVGEVYRFGWTSVSLSRCELAEGSVRSASVVVLQISGEYLAQVVFIDDQQPVEELAAQGSDDPLADRVRSGRLRRAGHDPDALRGEQGVDRAGELARPGR